jgi:TolA-binding protein
MAGIFISSGRGNTATGYFRKDRILNLRKYISICVLAFLLLAPAIVRAQNTKPTSNEDLREMVQNLMETIRLQQKSINSIQKKMDKTDKELSEIKQILYDQTQSYKQAKEDLNKERKNMSASNNMSDGEFRSNDEYAAELQFKNAYSIQRIARFDPHVKRKDQGPYYRRAIKEFELVVERYPKTRRADDSQIRVARLYRTLKETEKAKEAYQKLIDMFPDSEYVDEAQDRLADLGNR